MMVKPSVTDLLKKVDNRYYLVVASSKRARQIAAGATPMTKEHSDSALTLAVNEIAEGKVEIVKEN